MFAINRLSCHCGTRSIVLVLGFLCVFLSSISEAGSGRNYGPDDKQFLRFDHAQIIVVPPNKTMEIDYFQQSTSEEGVEIYEPKGSDFVLAARAGTSTVVGWKPFVVSNNTVSSRYFYITTWYKPHMGDAWTQTPTTLYPQITNHPLIDCIDCYTVIWGDDSGGGTFMTVHIQ